MGPKIHYCTANELTYPVSDFIVGFAGQADVCLELADYFRYPDTYKGIPRIPGGKMTGMVVTADGSIFQFTNPGKWLLVRDKVFAVGSGALVALGALHAGASPKDAVLAASKVDPFTGMGTKVLKFK